MKDTEEIETQSDKYVYSLKGLYREFSKAVIPIVTTNKDGDQGIGAAFHVGEGIFITATHIFERQVNWQAEVHISALFDFGRDHEGASKKIKDAVYGDQDFWKDGGFVPYEFQPLAHKDPSKDVSAFAIKELSFLPSIPLGSHLDDWIKDDDFILNEVLILGFPPIPLSKQKTLFASRAQINAVVDLIQTPHVHFILSSMARGGFSGGAVISEWGFALGVVTSSLLKNSAVEEQGYLTALTVEPILECLGQHGLLPSDLSEEWGDLFANET